jgi:hypothetical protein
VVEAKKRFARDSAEEAGAWAVGVSDTNTSSAALADDAITSQWLVIEGCGCQCDDEALCVWLAQRGGSTTPRC